MTNRRPDPEYGSPGENGDHVRLGGRGWDLGRALCALNHHVSKGDAAIGTPHVTRVELRFHDTGACVIQLFRASELPARGVVVC